MDSLTPDKEDLDRFRQERNKPKPGKPAGSSEPTQAAGTVPSARPKSSASHSGGGGVGWLVAFVLVLVIAVAAISFWQIFRQQATIDQLQQQLTEAGQYINQSKLVIARLEGSLNETEANVSQSGSQLSTRLSNIDSEVRKLWDVANKRNIELIKESQNKVEGLESLAKRLDERLKVAEQSVGTATKAATDQQAGIAANQRALDEVKAKLVEVEQGLKGQVDSQSKEMQAQLTALRNKIESFNTALAKQSSTPNVDGRLKDVEVAIDSIDVNRQQLNRRVVELERRLNETQLKVDSIPAGQR